MGCPKILIFIILEVGLEQMFISHPILDSGLAGFLCVLQGSDVGEESVEYTLSRIKN